MNTFSNELSFNGEPACLDTMQLEERKYRTPYVVAELHAIRNTKFETVHASNCINFMVRQAHVPPAPAYVIEVLDHDNTVYRHNCHSATQAEVFMATAGRHCWLV